MLTSAAEFSPYWPGGSSTVKRPITMSIVLSLALLAAPRAHASDAPAATPAAVDSILLLEHAFAVDSTSFDLLYRLGVMYMDRDRVADALRMLQMANRRRPKDMRTLVNLGAALDASGRAGEAQEYYRRALVAAPNDSVAVCRLASSLYSQAKYPEAVNLLRDLIKTKPRSYCAYFTLGVAFADAGMYRDAIRMWRKVVEIAPSSPEATSAKESIEVLQKFVQ
jgi:tetratricopeptide (TPR) repeat protein